MQRRKQQIAFFIITVFSIASAVIITRFDQIFLLNRYAIAYQNENTGGWKNTSIGWRYQKPDQTYQILRWMQDEDGKWYHFNEIGVVDTGWLKDRGRWYYLNQEADGTQGAMLTGWFQEDEEKRYYLNPGDGDMHGVMLTGWFREDENWYFADSAGILVTGMAEVDGKLYYLNPEPDTGLGIMQTGNVIIGGREYTFDENGVYDGEPLSGYAVYDGDGERLD